MACVPAKHALPLVLRPCAQDDARRLQAAEAQLMGPNASGFQVPVGQQPASAAPGGPAGAGPFGWGAPGGGWGAGGAPAAPQGAGPLQAPVLTFAGPTSSGAFVFGAGQAQQAQQEQQVEMTD